MSPSNTSALALVREHLGIGHPEAPFLDEETLAFARRDLATGDDTWIAARLEAIATVSDYVELSVDEEAELAEGWIGQVGRALVAVTSAGV